jgi:hypothetical protein
MRNSAWILVGIAAAGALFYVFGGGRELLAGTQLPGARGRGPELIHDRDGRAWFRIRGDDAEQRAIEACFDLENRELRVGGVSDGSVKFCCRVRGRHDCDRPEQTMPPVADNDGGHQARVRFVDDRGREVPADKVLEGLDARTAHVEFEQGARLDAVDPAGTRTSLGSDQYNRAVLEGWGIRVGSLFCRLKNVSDPQPRPIKKTTEKFECW